MGKKTNTILFSILFIFVFVYISKNSNIIGTKRLLISLEIASIIIFGWAGRGNAKDITIIPEVTGLQPPLPRRNQNNLRSNNPALGLGANKSPQPISGKGADKPPRGPIGFRTPPPLKKQGFYGGATGFSESGSSGSGSPGDDSNPNNSTFNTKSSDQCQNPYYLNQGQKKPKKKKEKNSPLATSTSNFSNYRGGSSPFQGYNYKDPKDGPQKVGFNQPKRLNKSYDKHAQDCFGLTQNRNKQTLQEFQQCVQDYINAPGVERFDGCYRYETPAYHYLKNGTNMVVTINAITNEYISARNATKDQLENMMSPGHNLGYDSRPPMTLRLRGPGN